ncbi:M56 family metallopeptidase [Prosthecobacter vanneervenii]|uniref:M56 family metallopeptidase n=1 Tax=Prosthecobacter vanneervenii TaxID=48466 RepID=UPI00161DBA15|nr:M56 family metallopeptidase [Prosthecobacter vanneervenii]
MNTLANIFDWLLATSFRASILTLVVLLAQAVLRRQLTARMRHALWLPVLVVLLMPVFPQSRWSIEYVFQKAPTPALEQIIPSDMAPAEELAPVIFESARAMPEPIHWQSMMLFSWISVAAGTLILGGISFVLTLGRLRRASQPASEELVATLAQIALEMRLRHVPRLVVACNVSSPAVTGLLRPTLLLPVEFDRDFTPVETRLVLKHELMHIKRGDLQLNALMCVLMTLHWFNPLLWIAFFKIRADREAACDAQVLHNAPAASRVEYGHALLKVETAFCPRGLSLGFVGIFQRGSALRTRIQLIAVRHNPHPLMKAIINACIIVMTFFGITRAQKPEPARDFTLGQASFKAGDSIRIHSVQTTAESITVAVDYELASEEEAYVSLFITVKNSDPTPVDPRQRAAIKKGRGSVVLVHPHPQPGLPHVTFYSKDGHPFGGIYFGTQEEAAASKALNLNYMLDASAPKTATPTEYIQNKLDRIIIPTVRFQEATVEEALEYLRVKSRDMDVTTQASNQRGVNIIFRQDISPSKANITLDLKDVPLGEALRYVVELAGMKMSIQPYAVIVAKSFPTARSTATEVPHAPAAGKIVIPDITFREATLTECCEFIRIKSRELDPKKKGVNILIKPGAAQEANITLSLKNVPVSEALYYCASLAHHKLSSDGQSYLLTPVSAESPEKKGQASGTAAKPAMNTAESQAAELRIARQRQYDFNKANLGDVLRYLATDAGINFVSLSEDSTASKKLVTFSVRASPFEVLEALCRTNGLVMGLEQGRWIFRDHDDKAVVIKSYALNKPGMNIDVVLKDIDSLLSAGEAKSAVVFDKDNNSFKITTTRQQHSWVSAYFQGINSTALAGGTK